MKNKIPFLLAACWLSVVLPQVFQWPDTLHEKWRKTLYPDEGVEVRTNPVALYPSIGRNGTDL